jgi:hypothetical protein
MAAPVWVEVWAVASVPWPWLSSTQVHQGLVHWGKLLHALVVLAAAAGALSALTMHYVRNGYFSLLRLTNGLLAGG